MRKLWIAALVLFVQCKSGDDGKKGGAAEDTIERTAQSDTSTLLQQYWLLEDSENPKGSDIIEKDQGIDYMPGIVFIDGGTVTENPAGRMRTGTYQREGDTLRVKYADDDKVVYAIEKLSTDSLRMERQEGKQTSTMYYSSTNTWWPNKDTNPFTTENMAWMVKPKEAETDEQIKQRTEEYIRFCQYYIEGYARGNATKISFVGIPNIFNYYTGALSIPSDDKLNQKWVDCFYNLQDAQKGYALIRHAILKKYTWNNDESNWIKQTGPVLKAMRDSL